MLTILSNMDKTWPLFVYFRPFQNAMTIIQPNFTYIMIKANMVCLRFEPGAAG